MSDVDLRAQIEELRQRLAESDDTLSAIRNGEVDALVVGGSEIYTLEGADHPYRVLVEAMQQGAVTLSPDRAVVYCNAGFGNMVGQTPEKLIGVCVESLFCAADAVVLRELLAAIPTAPSQAELTLAALDGSRLPVLVSFNLLPLQGMEAVCLVITDLTEHRHNQQLQDTDRRKDEFLAMLAHELRNPLAPISNAVHMLSLWNKEANADVQWACDVVERQVGQMSRIVDDLLDVSRITRGKVQMRMAPTDVSAIVAAAVETSRPLIESRRHKLNIALAAESLKVNADLTRMAQVVTNLLNNAAKYTEEGGEIWLECVRRGSEARIVVRDTGVGIPAEMLPNVFDLFTQVDRTIDRSQGGLGIGLTLVRSLIEMHGGQVSVSSAGLGHGSEFVLRIPLLAAAGEGKVEDRSQQSPGHRVEVPQRILVVDDNIDGALTLAFLLRAMGHTTEVAHDGPAAVESSETLLPSLVLLDIGLPVMNGYMVAERLRQNPALRGTVIAALTGYGDEQDLKRSKAAGFDHHFVKPLSLPALQTLIRSLPSPA